ncbi:MAG: hypothetical protein Q9M19_04825 [Mariprofundaceae bacterium]|nr:hypothetical protein [Mariprofundaceae bacterium]
MDTIIILGRAPGNRNAWRVAFRAPVPQGSESIYADPTFTSVDPDIQPADLDLLRTGQWVERVEVFEVPSPVPPVNEIRQMLQNRQQALRQFIEGEAMTPGLRFDGVSWRISAFSRLPR